MKGVNELTCKSCKVLKSLDSFQGGKRQTNNIVCIDCDLKHNRMNNQLTLNQFNEELNRKKTQLNQEDYLILQNEDKIHQGLEIEKII
jgi:hypothetical protein